MQHLGPKESGASIVGVMVAMTLFAVVAVMAGQSFRNIGTSGRRVDASMSARDAEANIVQAVVAKYKTFVQNRCTDLPTFDARTQVGTFASLMAEKVVFLDAKGSQTTTPTVANEDIRRCSETPFTKFNLPVVDSFYSCYNITISDDARNKASRDVAGKAAFTSNPAFAANRGAFIEFYVRIRDLQTDKLLTCDQVTGAGRGIGLEVLYSLHWATSGGSKTVTSDKETLDIYYDNKTGSLSAAL